jgi:uncharacterized protein YjbI with pentapeptide repeats
MNLMNDFINENEGLDYREHDFTNANLRNKNFKGANLEYAIFVNAILEGSNLEGAKLKRADLSGANMRFVNLEDADLRGADLRYVDLRNANLRYADLADSNLERISLNRANLRHANLSNTYGYKANLTDANLTKSNLEDAFLKDATLKSANLTRSNLTNANLTNANLTNANLTRSNLSNTNLLNANLTNANLTNANTTNVNIRGAVLDGATHNIYSIETQNLLNKISSKVDALEPIRIVDTFDKVNVYDFVDGEILKKDVDDDNVIFYIENQYQGISYPRDNLEQAYDDRSSLFVSCSGISQSAVNIANVKPNILYFRINLTMTVFVSIDSIKDLLVSKHKEWYIKRTEVEEEFISSIEVVYDRGEMNIFGEELNIVSRDHCQSGTNQIISVLSPVTLVLQGGVMSKKRFRKRNCKTKKRK